MTEKLKALMDERASAPDFAVPDLDALRTAGARRRRRQQGAGALGGLAAATAVVALISTGLPGGPAPDAGPPVATDRSTPARGSGYSYALGSVIHDTSGTIDVGHPVRVYVRTRLGYVTADDTGRVWSVVDGRVEQLGQAEPSTPSLVSDPSSGTVAWIDVGDGGAFVLHDLDEDREDRFPASSAGEGPALYALDDGVVYARDGSELVAIDAATGTRTVLDAEVDDDDAGVDADGGQVVSVTFTPSGAEATVGPPDGPSDGASTFAVSGGSPVLSPGADYLALGDDEAPAYEVATGRTLALDLDGFYEPYEWWDDTTLAVIAETAEGSGRATLLGCDVRTGRCTTAVADLGAFDEIGDGLSLPVGDQ